ncbi:MAG: Fe-S protein assembly co-chaperone HscB [Bacteroidota bacterium]
MNYFEFFALPISPKVDQAVLKRKFYENSRRFHPDFFTLESDDDQAEALEKSTYNNEAFQTLKDDDRRLKYLLDLKGALAEEGKNQVPQDFLFQVMEVNEALMELEFGEDPNLKEKTLQTIESLEQDLTKSVQSVLEDYDDEMVTEAELNQLRDYYLKRRYLLRIREKI